MAERATINIAIMAEVSGQAGDEDVDQITDSAGSDTLRLGDDLAAHQLWVRRLGADLVLQRLGTTNRLTISGYFDDASTPTNFGSGRVESIRSSDDLLLSQNFALVLALTDIVPPSGFDPDSMGTLPLDVTEDNDWRLAWGMSPNLRPEPTISGGVLDLSTDGRATSVDLAAGTSSSVTLPGALSSVLHVTSGCRQ